MRAKLIAALTLPALFLSACVSPSGGPRQPTPPRGGHNTHRPAPPPPTGAGQRPAQQTYRDNPSTPVHGSAGSIMGRDVNALISMFGQPRLNRRDGAATVMQFTGRNCMIDAYLYVQREGGTPVVAHVDARSISDGSEVDRQGCINALQRR